MGKQAQELATDFANVCSSDVCKGVSSYTSSVIMNDLKLPDNYSEMSSEDVEYITGEWSIFGWNPQISDLIGRYYNGDRAGQNWLELKGYMYFGAGTWGAIQTSIAAGLVTGPIGVGVTVAGVICGAYCGAVGISLTDAYANAKSFYDRGLSYEVRENKWLGVVNGYEANQI